MADKYYCLVFKDGWRAFRDTVFTAHKVIPAIFTAPIMVIFTGLLFQRTKPAQMVIVSFFKALGSVVLVYVAVLFIIFLWYLFTAPGRLHKKETDARLKAESEAVQLRLKSESRNILEIVMDYDGGFWQWHENMGKNVKCQIGVKNTSMDKTSNNVGITLILVTRPTGESIKVAHEFGATGKNSPPVGGYDNGKPTTRIAIHPGETISFDIFLYSFIGTNRVITVLPDANNPLIIRTNEFQSQAWCFRFRVTGTDVVSKERDFKLELDGHAPPKFYSV